MNKGQVNWSCVYVMEVQDRDRLHLLKIGASKNPEQRAKDLSGELGITLVVRHFMRVHLPLGKQILHEAFAEHCIEDDWFLPHDRVKGFFRDCMANGYKVLSPSVIADVLSKYTRNAASYAKEAEAYKTIFDAEYRFLKSNSGKVKPEPEKCE